jgi:site-specific DNA-methyltransferase (adenine-specific)
MEVNTIICGAMPQATKVFPDGYFNCCISSPPYWALRDYGVDGQLGLEPTFEEYIDKLCAIYDEVKRVLRADGTCWVNLGDTYAGSGRDKEPVPRSDFQVSGVSAKSLCLIPQRFAIEMVNRGWILRNVIIWHKPNPMPSSAKDRFTVDFEYVYFFVKSKKYWFEPQYEPADSPPGHKWNLNTPKTFGGNGHIGKNTQNKNRAIWELNPLGRNKRTVWTIPTQPFPEAHFATFPEKLVAPMIKAGCPEFVCTKCGKAREKIIEATGGTIGQDWNQNIRGIKQGEDLKKGTKTDPKISDGTYRKEFKGYTDCGCKADWRPGIVLDCFCRQWDYFTGSSQAA